MRNSTAASAGSAKICATGCSIWGFPAAGGVGFYVACAIVHTDIESAARAVMPYLIVLLIGLGMVAFVP